MPSPYTVCPYAGFCVQVPEDRRQEAQSLIAEKRVWMGRRRRIALEYLAH